MKEYLQIKVFELFDGKTSIKKFEEWIYKNSNKIEDYESDELYLELISFNYKSKHSKAEFFIKFDKLINWKNYEENRIISILDSIINKDDKIGQSIIETYNLRNAGYSFFEDLGMINGLNLISRFDYGMTEWENIPKFFQEKLIEENYQEARNKAILVKEWILNGKVVLTGKRGGEYNRYIYTDNRNSEEYKTWTITDVSKTRNKQITKKWWQFWIN